MHRPNSNASVEPLTLSSLSSISSALYTPLTYRTVGGTI